ncbi:Ig-like domain-containing protein [Neobacillus terrae]|uniref:Ig-like domain-containing protein n=1 Tax=Neobacillus terrae TaxID=3034837 RepID=UPI0014092113|nr:Ig-like domain-containing protein [Neobacillus terrae]NHM30026.1 hypothetical protein [Neobacillus terrae]
MKVFKSLIAFILLFSLALPAATYGETSTSAKTLFSQMNLNQEPKILSNKEMSYQNPQDYPMVQTGQMLPTLYDQYGGWQKIGYNSTVNDSNDSKSMNIKLNYSSQYYYAKDNNLTMEFFRENNGALEYIAPFNFNTSSYKSVGLIAILPKEDYQNSKYIYIRAGISDDYSDYYSDVTLFKIENPFYLDSVPSTVPAATTSGSFTLISNESLQGSVSESTGTLFKLNNDQFAYNKNLNQSSYRLDVNIPFNVKVNADKKIASLYTTKSDLIGNQKSFWVKDLTTNLDYQINGTLTYSGTKANVWVYNNSITSTDAQRLGIEFDQKIYPSVTNNFATESDVNHDGKINILCYDIHDGFNGSGGYVAGYFYGGDLYNINHSNLSEIFYLDTYPAMGMGTSKDVSSTYSTLAHEFQHMVNFNQNVFVEGTQNPMDTWLNEGLSMAAEQIYTGSTLTNRIDYYNNAASIPAGLSLLNWQNSPDLLGNYSLSYLFGQYVKLQSNQGNNIFKEILKDRNNNYLAIEDVVKKHVRQDLTFGKFMTDFRAALLLKEAQGLYGFKGDSQFDSIQPRISGTNPGYLTGGGAVAMQSSSELAIPSDKGPDVTYTFLSKGNTPTVNLVSDKDTAITGKTESRIKVFVKAGSIELGNAESNADGNFSIPIPKQKAGNILKVYSVNSAGIKSSEILVTILDKTPPAIPTVNEVKDYDRKVTGKAEPASYVALKAGSTVVGNAVTDSLGNFAVGLKSPLTAGTNLYVSASDKEGNVSPSALTVVKDKTPPAAPFVNEVKDYEKRVSGKAEPGSKVEVKSGNTILGTGNADKYRNFVVNLKAAQKAGSAIYVNAIDGAGNSGAAVRVVIKDKTPPSAPSVNKVTYKSIYVTGKSEAYSIVYINLGNKTIGWTKANQYGSYSIKVSKQSKGTKLYIYAKDPASNISKSTVTSVK